jgi:prepilin-type processing-associated H-X9-DG protein
MAQLNEDSWREGMSNSEARARNLGCGCMLLILGAILVGLLMPAVGSGPPSRRAQCSNNLKQIGLAMDMYRDSAGVFPARAILSLEGKPLLSWRVSLLPYLGGAALIKEFHLDEPWDSPHNLTLIDKMPEALKCPTTSSHNKTHYLAVVGPGTIFEGNSGVAIQDVQDALCDTIMIVEADQEVNWTKPEEFDFDASAPRRNLRGIHPGGAMALMVDGSSRSLRTEIDDATIQGLMTKAGGENVRLPD